MIASLLPPAARAAELLRVPPGSGPGSGPGTAPEPDGPSAALHPREAAHLEHALPKRRREFTATRVCARRALRALGIPPAPILPGSHGAPQWPAGVVGSLTHRRGYCAAAVARATDLLALGIDAEPNAPLPPAVVTTFALPEERRHLRAHPDHPGVHRDRLLFSAKESVYKAWFPLTQRVLRPQDIQIVLPGPPAGPAPRTGTFHAHVLAGAGPPASFAGRWLAHPDLILTAVAVPHPAPAREPG
ncbi:4'-phosphopantetheinyl transferase family protein [Streptomyces alanosinicus]|uniref:4'-phosphopantetheinyl transferase n=1 Tax=Streptomyces alanosinicus TaxID=68171 RepID=A0A918YU31_9ACTN|nr:4'-phosphopantetheinyl transferase superfamily protein [Streptomyces alanosinicus]GHE16133.1 4'-phosphopantetheinyl transferase [Streptomyces alanosinicus]